MQILNSVPENWKILKDLEKTKSNSKQKRELEFLFKKAAPKLNCKLQCPYNCNFSHREKDLKTPGD